MPSIAIVYHSGFGHTKVQAEAVLAGVDQVPTIHPNLIPVDNVEDNWTVLDNADAIIFGSPTYFAGPSAQFKTFMDATSSRWLDQVWANKLAAGFTNSAGASGDKLATLQHLSLFAFQHAMVWVGLGLPPGNHTSTGSPDDLNRLSSFIGAMAQSNADEGPEIAPTKSDQLTATHLGLRVARAASGWDAVQNQLNAVPTTP